LFYELGASIGNRNLIYSKTNLKAEVMQKYAVQTSLRERERERERERDLQRKVFVELFMKIQHEVKRDGQTCQKT
jgi:hypothetical protein